MEAAVPVIPDPAPRMAPRYRLLAGGFTLAERLIPARLLPSLDDGALIRAAQVQPRASARLGAGDRA
jgi:hypothetical protein